MCGRFSLGIMDIKTLSERFHAQAPRFDWQPRYNISPSQPILTVVDTQRGRQLAPMEWGLIPHWSKEGVSNYNLINVRSETLIQKPTFKFCFERQRCAVPADGFFEWQKTSSGKVPFRAILKHEEIFSFAGLWDRWQAPNGLSIYSFTILTTEANKLLYPIHNRMPVILSREAEDAWLDSTITQTDLLEPFLKPYPSKEMEIYEVSKLINSPRNDSIKCIQATR